jgi:hypothetical protein
MTRNYKMHPAMVKAIENEKKIILDLLADATYYKGCSIKDFERAIKSQLDYKPTTVKDRVIALTKEGMMHRADLNAKGGAHLFLLGPEPEPAQLELADVTPESEPPLAGDELLSFMFEMEKKVCLKIVRLEELVQTQQSELRLMANHVVRANVLITALCEEMDVKVG